MAEKAVDSRVRRTKRLLKQGLTELMAQKSIKKITVRELSELVDINPRYVLSALQGYIRPCGANRKRTVSRI